MNTKLNFSKEDITFNGTENEKKLKEKLFDDSLLIAQKDDEIKRLQKENERLKQNQVKALNRIRDFINASKCEIIEDSYCNDKHSQYWKMFKKIAEEIQDKIKGVDTKNYVYIPKWREQELLKQEKQLDIYKTRIDKAISKIDEVFAEEDWYENYEYNDLEDVLKEVKEILQGSDSK